MIKEVKVSMQAVDKLFNYLGRRPYVEVAQIIAELTKEIDPQLVPKQLEQPKAGPITIDAKDLVDKQDDGTCGCGDECQACVLCEEDK